MSVKLEQSCAVFDTLLMRYVSRSPWLLGQMKTSLVRSCVLSSRKNEAQTLFTSTLPAPVATNESALSCPTVVVVTFAAGFWKYVRGKFPLFSLAYIWRP